MRAVTDLPEPDSPTTATTSPAATWKLTPCTAATSPASVAKSTFSSSMLSTVPSARAMLGMRFSLMLGSSAGALVSVFVLALVYGACRNRGSVRSFMDSPTRVRPSTVSTMAAPG